MRRLGAVIVSAIHVFGTALAKPNNYFDKIQHFMGLEDRNAVIGDAVDDAKCVYDWKSLQCQPEHACSLQYEFGDTTPSQACRVKKDSIMKKVPQQLHLAFAGEEAGTGMTISWTTFSLDKEPAVWLGRNSTNHALVKGLEPKTTYFYKVGNANEKDYQSSINSFKTARASGDPSEFTVAVYGDLGADENSVATNKYVNSFTDEVDFIWHIGDIAYADIAFTTVDKFFGFFYEEVYNRFMNSMTFIMRRMVYMVLVGNHEAGCYSPSCLVSDKRDKLGNYSAFNARFRMPSLESRGVLNMWYSHQYASVHFTSISTETDYRNAPRNAFGINQRVGNFGNQTAWLEADLKAANANRDKVPWIIVGMHRPLYSSRSCDDTGNPSNDYETLNVQQAFEELFLKYKVDLVLQGHVHAYERTYPIAKGRAIMEGVVNSSIYNNPQAPVYVISGIAGGPGGFDRYEKPASPNWLVTKDDTRYSISKLTVTPTNLTLTTIESATGLVYDKFSIIKTAIK